MGKSKIVENMLFVLFLVVGFPILGTPLSQVATKRSTSDFIGLDSFSATIPGAALPLFSDLSFEFSPGKKYALVSWGVDKVDEY